MTRSWDAATYDRLPLPHVAWGEGVLDRLGLSGDEQVLDAGCGTGRDLARLLERHPGATAIGVDASASMLAQARDRLAPFAGRVELVEADLVALPPLGPVDAVMSVAAFHWVTDHDALFAGLASVMRPGARLATDAGGQGNIANVEAGLAAVRGVTFTEKRFAGVDATRERLERAGFLVEDVRLRPDPLVIDDPAVRSLYLRTIALGSQLAGLPADEHAAFADAVRDAMPSPVIDYVRLEIDAVRR